MNNYLVTLFTSIPWAIDKAALDGLLAQARQISDQDVMAAAERVDKRDGSPAPYDVIGDAAIIRVKGNLTNEASFFSILFGGRSYAGIRAQVEAALSDPKVGKIVLKVFSPGGIVPGVSELAAYLSRADKQKPIYTYADGQMTSAAYWLGAVGRKVAAPKTALIGSIGVRWMHIDESKLNERVGISVTHMTAGQYKAVGNPDAPLSSSDKAYLQERWDSLYTIFIDSVAQYRNMEAGAVLAAADGKIFLADQAKDNGLIDMIVSDFDDFLRQIKSIQEDSTMDYNTLKTEHPDIFKQIRDEGYQAGHEAAAAAPAGPDQTQILEYVGLAAGDEAKQKVSALIDTGMKPAAIQTLQGIFGVKPQTEAPPAGGDGNAGNNDGTPPAADADGSNPDLASRQKILDGINSQATPPLAAGNNGDQPSGQPQDFNVLVTAYMTEHKCSKGKAIQAVKTQNPEAHEAYLQQQNKKG